MPHCLQALLVVAVQVVSLHAALTIPAHTTHVATTLRHMLGRFYYPTPSPSQDLSHDLSHDLPSSLCLAHSALTLASTEPWSLAMWDASGKMSDGVAAGATEARGHPGLCQGVTTDFPGTLASHILGARANLTLQGLNLDHLNREALSLENTALKGLYCLVSVRDSSVGRRFGPGSSQLFASLAGKYENTFATCIPDTCTATLLQEALQRQYPADVAISVACEVEEEDSQYTSSELGFMLTTMVLVALVAWATNLDVEQPCNKSKSSGCSCPAGRKVLHCFSLVQNGPRLFSVPSTASQYQTLDGLRVISMIWVILAHRYMLFLTSASNPNDILKSMGDWRYWWVFNAYPSVDTFFFISAFLVSVFLKERIQHFSFSGFYLQRYLRLVPTMMYVVWGCATVLRYVGSGLVWSRTYEDMFGRPCTNTAWDNLFFINNFNDSNDMCMGHLWSLAVEWQFFLVTPLILLPLYRCPSWRYRWLPLAASLVVSIIIPAAVTIAKDLPVTASYWDHHAISQYYNEHYMVPWCRAAPYCVGLAAGWLYHWMVDNNVTLKPVWAWCGQVASVVLVVGVLMGPTLLVGHGRYWAALYAALSRPLWACAIAFLVIKTARGKPGLVAWVFTRPCLAPLCKVSYSMYLVSLPLQTMAAARPYKNHYDPLTAIYLVVGDLVFSYGASVVLALLVESPCTRLLGLLASGKLSRRSSKSTSTSTSEATSTSTTTSTTTTTSTSKDTCPPTPTSISISDSPSVSDQTPSAPISHREEVMATLAGPDAIVRCRNL